jgi:protein-tyrosine phosphatase
MAPDDHVERFRVLVVCTANQYRSPLAEHLLREAVRDLDPTWELSSAGVRAIDGQPLDPLVAGFLHDHAIATDGWTSRRLTPEIVRRADLILTAEESHRRAVVTLEPAALRRTFLLLQFARLAQALNLERAAGNTARPGDVDLIDQILRVRAHLQPVIGDADALKDPAGKPSRLLKRCGRQIEKAVASIRTAVLP